MELAVLIWLVFGLLFLVFGLIPLKGAPWLPSLKSHRSAAFGLLNLKPGQTVIDLGCGDGRFLAESARRGYKSIGYELNPTMFVIAWLATRRHSRNVELHLKDFWQADISQADAIYVFLLDKYMSRLDKKIKEEGKKGILLASHTFRIPGKKPVNSRYGIYLYKY